MCTSLYLSPLELVRYVRKYALNEYQWSFAARCIDRGKVSRNQLRVLRDMYRQIKRRQYCQYHRVTVDVNYYITL